VCRAFQLIFLSPGCCASTPTMTPPLDRFKGNDTMITASRRQTTLVGVNPLTSILDWAKKRLRPG